MKKDINYAKKDNIQYPIELEDHRLNHSNPIKIYRNWHNPEKTSVLHFHNSIEVGFCDKGTGVNIIGNKVFPFCKGNFCIIPKGVTHWQLSNKGIESIWSYIFFHPESIISNFPSQQQQLSELFENILLINEEYQEEFKDLFFSILKEVELSKKGFEEIAKSQLFIFFLKLLQIDTSKYKIGISPSVKQGSLNRIVPALLSIKNNFHLEISIEDLAGKCNMSPRNFSRVFKKLMTTTPKVYLDKIRISMACFDLKNTTLPISEIAYKNGFQNLSHFERSFKRYISLSPSAFRNSSRIAKT